VCVCMRVCVCVCVCVIHESDHTCEQIMENHEIEIVYSHVPVSHIPVCV